MKIFRLVYRNHLLPPLVTPFDSLFAYVKGLNFNLDTIEIRQLIKSQK